MATDPLGTLTSTHADRLTRTLRTLLARVQDATASAPLEAVIQYTLDARTRTAAVRIITDAGVEAFTLTVTGQRLSAA